ncbi:unnamed protein product, partial [Meganyctiphanes norvegica]
MTADGTGKLIYIANTRSDAVLIQPPNRVAAVVSPFRPGNSKGNKILLEFLYSIGAMGPLFFTDKNPPKIGLKMRNNFKDHENRCQWCSAKELFQNEVFMCNTIQENCKWLTAILINIATEHMLYSESDLDSSLNKINVLNFHEEKEVNGIKFWCYHAGHVLGAAMFMIQIAGVKILYTGDFSRQEDRHLMMAEIPQIRPDVLMIESTYGVSIHEPRESRETRFTSTIHTIVGRGGRCLIPVFALGRAQELLLILDEYWDLHPELHEVPIYYASALAKKCMSVYQTYTHAMNERIQRQIAVSNPFQFKHISNLKGMDQFEDIGPCVIMASPGMMQSGLSRELFEVWCPDPKNGVIIAGYCVEGTLAKDILKEPEEVTTMSGQRLPMKCSVEYISFSAHTDFEQTSHFIRTIRPPNVVLVHGEMTEMARLKGALEREYEAETSAEQKVKVFNPKNLETVTFHFRGEKMAKVMGELAVDRPTEGRVVSGILVKRNFNNHIISSAELGKYSELAVSTVQQRLSVHYSGSWQLLHYLLASMYGNIEVVVEEEKENKSLKLFGVITLIYQSPVVVLEWVASPANDMYADAIMKVILKAQDLDKSIDDHPNLKTLPTFDKMHFKECLIELLQEMFGEESVPKLFKGEKLYVTVNNVKANIDLATMNVTCEHERVQKVVQTAVNKLYESLAPVEMS